MNNTNNLSYKKFVRKFFPSSFKERVLNSLDTLFRNNFDKRVINETRRLINQVFNQNRSNAVNQDLAVRYEKDIESNNDIYIDLSNKENAINKLNSNVTSDYVEGSLKFNV